MKGALWTRVIIAAFVCVQSQLLRCALRSRLQVGPHTHPATARCPPTLSGRARFTGLAEATLSSPDLCSSLALRRAQSDVTRGIWLSIGIIMTANTRKDGFIIGQNESSCVSAASRDRLPHSKLSSTANYHPQQNINVRTGSHLQGCLSGRPLSTHLGGRRQSGATQTTRSHLQGCLSGHRPPW